MNINLANIDFCPGQGGGGEAVIRTLNVTENGTYRAPSGVDGYSPVNVSVSGGGGSVTPEEQAALDTLVDSSEGVLYTNTYKRYNQVEINWPSGNNIDTNAVSSVFWDDLYIIDDSNLYKLNRESYQFDMMKHFDSLWSGVPFFGDKSGRLYWNGYELDLENGTIGQVQINMPDNYRESVLQNFLYGEYAVWILSYDSAYKFNESSQEFEQMPLNSTFQSSGPSVYINLFKYDGHILGVYSGLTFEVTEYEDHIDVADVTGVYFNMPSFGTDQFSYKTTKDGDLYIFSDYNIYIYNKLLGVWSIINDKVMRYPIYGYMASVSDNIIFSFYNGVYYMNLSPEFNITSWTKTSSVAVDLTSNQKISGQKSFEDSVTFNGQMTVKNIYAPDNISISAGSHIIQNVGSKIYFGNNRGNETIVKNGSKQIATVDQTFVNSTFEPYGQDGDNISYVSGSSTLGYNFNTYTNRMFKRVGSNWNEFDGTRTLIPVSFGFDFSGDQVFNSPSMTILIAYDNVSTNNTYMWDDANTSWDFICSSEQVGGAWFDGDDFRSGNEYKLVENGGVWSWVSDPLVNNIWDYSYKFVYKTGEVYAYNENDWHLYKYDKVNCTLDKIGFVNAGHIWAYFDELFMAQNSNETYNIDLSKVDPQNPDVDLIGKHLFNGLSSGFIGARDRLWYYNTYGEMCSSYQIIYETPEVPASNGTYTLKAVRVGDQITYSWVLDV